MIKLERLLQYIKQPSTLRGLAIIAGLCGVAVKPEWGTAIATFAGLVLGAIEVLRNEDKPKP